MKIYLSNEMKIYLSNEMKIYLSNEMKIYLSNEMKIYLSNEMKRSEKISEIYSNKTTKKKFRQTQQIFRFVLVVIKHYSHKFVN